MVKQNKNIAYAKRSAAEYSAVSVVDIPKIDSWLGFEQKIMCETRPDHVREMREFYFNLASALLMYFVFINLHVKYYHKVVGRESTDAGRISNSYLDAGFGYMQIVSFDLYCETEFTVGG